MFKLNDYQDNAITALDSFFRQLRMNGLAGAWQNCAPLSSRPGHGSTFSVRLCSPPHPAETSRLPPCKKM